MRFFKRIIIVFLLIILFNFLEYGFVWNRWDQFAYPGLLVVITYLVLYLPKFRKISLITSFVFLLIMVFLYLMNELVLANVMGSFGFAILLIVTASYLPQIISKGFVDRF